jgi:hypothetical protein
MKKQLAFLILSFAFIITFSACKKDDEPKQSAKFLALTAKPWKLQNAMVLEQDVVALGLGQYLGGLSNAEFKFNTDGTYTATNRTTNSSAPGKWEFGSNETRLITDKGTAEERTYEVVTLTNTNLDLRWSINKSTIDTSQLPENIRLLLLSPFTPANIPVDLKLVPAQ